MTVWLYFKLFNNIKSPHEAHEFAMLELEGLHGPVDPVENFALEFQGRPLSSFSSSIFEGDAEIKVVDAFTHELPYGRVQGYKSRMDRVDDISHLVERLAYTREVFAITESDNPMETLQILFPKAEVGVNAQHAIADGLVLWRLIVHQFFLENSEYISKLSRNEMEVDANVDRLFSYLTKRLYRIPSSSTLRVGKRLEDYFAVREEPSLYLVHYLHPYKGKFHPKMARALLNYVCPRRPSRAMDNYAGSGTLLVEASLMGLDSVGVEVNPLSALMSRVKCDVLRDVRPEQLRKEIESFLSDLEAVLRGVPSLEGFDPDGFKDMQKTVRSEEKALRDELRRWDKKLFGIEEDLAKMLLAKHFILSRFQDGQLRRFFLLALSGSISDATRRRSADFANVFADRLWVLYLRVYLFKRLNSVLRIDVGRGTSFEGDTRDLVTLDLPPVNGNVNSPPYSTALNYIRNDQPQLSILGLSANLDDLVARMVGYPGINYDKLQLLEEIKEAKAPFSDLPAVAQETVRRLLRRGRADAALRSYRFFLDTLQAMTQVFNVLRPGAKYATIIGNNWYKTDGSGTDESEEWGRDDNSLGNEVGDGELDYRNIPTERGPYLCVKNDEVTLEVGKQVGFELDRVITRLLEKTSVGNIRYESIVILRKPAG